MRTALVVLLSFLLANARAALMAIDLGSEFLKVGTYLGPDLTRTLSQMIYTWTLYYIRYLYNASSS